MAAGLSLGEYGALAAAGVMELPDLFRIIRMRGIYMQEAYPEGGAMAAILGLDGDTVAKSADRQQKKPAKSSRWQIITARADRDHRRGRCSSSSIGSTERSRCKTLCTLKGQRTIPFSFAENCGRTAGRRIEKRQAVNPLDSLRVQRNSGLCDRCVTGCGTAETTGIQSRSFHPERRADDRRWRGHFHRDRPGEDTRQLRTEN